MAKTTKDLLEFELIVEVDVLGGNGEAERKDPEAIAGRTEK